MRPLTGFQKKILCFLILPYALLGGLQGDAASTEPGPEGIEWHLAEIGDAPAAPLAAHDRPSLLLDAVRTQATGFTGCNSFFGSYALDRASLKFGLIGSTRRACPEQGSDLEAKFLSVLARTRAWKVQDGTLLLVDSGGPLARFTRGTGAKADVEPGSMTYRSRAFPSGTVNLSGGKYRAPAAPGSASEITVTLTDKRVFGSINGRETGAVVLAVSPGGTGTFSELALLSKGAKGWENTETVLLGDRVIVRSVGIYDDHLVVDMTVHGPGDPLCCPTLEVKRSFVVQGERLIPAAGP